MNDSRGFTYIEALIALGVMIAAMAIVMQFFVDFGSAMNTESTTLSTQQSSRFAVDELARQIRQTGYGIRRPDPYNPAIWQRGVVYAGSHVLAINADIDGSIGTLGPTETIAFPGGSSYTGEGFAAALSGAETWIYTLDGDGSGAIEPADRTAAATGSYNPAADTENPLDFALFRKVYGFNGTDYGGETLPLTASLLTNATTDFAYPDGSTPEPLFTYWLSEDLNQDGVLSPEECVNNVVDTCPPSTLRAPLNYLWGDTNFDEVLSEAEKSALRSLEVGSPVWSANRLASGGVYNSTSLRTAMDPDVETSNEITINDGTKLGPGYMVVIGSGATAERFYVESVDTSNVPHKAVLSTLPTSPHAAAESIQVLQETLLRAVRAVGIQYTAVTDKKDTNQGARAAGRMGRRGDNGLDYRVTPLRRRVEIINTTTNAMSGGEDISSEDICPLRIVNACSSSVSEQASRYAGVAGAPDLEFVVTDVLGNAIPKIEVTFNNSNPTIGTVGGATSKSDASGLSAIAYTPTGTLGTDSVTASVECYDDAGTRYSDSATADVSVYQISTSVSNDCLSTVSSRTLTPRSDFTLQVTSDSGPVPGHALGVGLELDQGYLPTSPDFTAFVGELIVGGSPAGVTGVDGRLAPVTFSTDSNGTILGSLGMITDTAQEGARLKLITDLREPACTSPVGTLEDKTDFFRLELDSTSPSSGCSDLLPCTVTATDPIPEVQAGLFQGGSPVSGTPLTFSATDINPPGSGSTAAASLLMPDSGVQTGFTGLADVIVSNNGSVAITPATPLRTDVDVVSPGPPSLCSSGRIESSSAPVGFEFEDPIKQCDTAVQQAWVSSTSSDSICLSVRNDNSDDASDPGCPLDLTGIRVTVFNGGLPAGGHEIQVITGGGMSSSPSCSNSGTSLLFRDMCQFPTDNLDNGETWMFSGFGVCSTPPNEPDPQEYFIIDMIKFAADYTPGLPAQVTVFYECKADCDGMGTVSRTFNITLP